MFTIMPSVSSDIDGLCEFGEKSGLNGLSRSLEIIPMSIGRSSSYIKYLDFYTNFVSTFVRFMRLAYSRI